MDTSPEHHEANREMQCEYFCDILEQIQYFPRDIDDWPDEVIATKSSIAYIS
jgi:hypothetical protein